MNSLISEFPGFAGETPRRGWIFYDGECGLCLDLVHRFETRLTRAGFAFIPLQTKGVKERLGLTMDNLLNEMKVLDRNGKILGGANAVVYLAKYIWWATPLALIAHLPFGEQLLKKIYRAVAERRNCANGACRNKEE